MDRNIKVDGVDTYTANDCNQVTTEMETAISDTGQTPNNGDLTQLSKTIANYSMSGDYFNDSSVTNNLYTLSTLGSKRAPTALVDGMRVRFMPHASNTASASVTVSGLTNKLVRYQGLTLGPGLIVAGQLTELRYDLANDWFDLVSAYPPTGTINGIRDNILINPSFNINQRYYDITTLNPTTVPAGTFFRDRWKAFAGAGPTSVYRAASYDGILLSGDGWIAQVIEVPATPTGLAGKTITLSLRLVTAALGVVYLIDTGLTGTLIGTAGSRVSATMIIPGGSTGNITVRLRHNGSPIQISDIKVEVGNTATEFRERLIGHELSLCQRYYERGFGGYSWTFQSDTGSPIYPYAATWIYFSSKRTANKADWLISFNETLCRQTDTATNQAQYWPDITYDGTFFPSNRDDYSLNNTNTNNAPGGGTYVAAEYPESPPVSFDNCLRVIKNTKNARVFMYLACYFNWQIDVEL